MLKKKICQLLAAVMITTTVMGSNVHAVWATERTDVIDVQSFSEKKFQTGTYIVKNSTEYIGDSTSSIGTSMARKALKEDTVITVSEDKTTMTLKFADDMYKMMKNIKATLDGVNLNSVNNEEDKSITFEVPSAEAKVRIDMTITIMGKEVSFLVTNDISTIPTIDNSSDKDEDQNQGNKLADGKYIIANKTLKSGGDSQSGIRNYIDANSIVTVKDGKVTVTMKYNKDGLETVKSTNSITIDGNEVAFVKNEDGSISFNVDSIDKLYTRVKINLTYFNEGLPEVVFPGKLHTVDVDLLHEGELSEYKENDSSTDSGNNGETNKPGNENNSGNAGNEDSNNGGSNTNDSNNNGSNSGTTEVQGTKVYVGKNTVTHENETGRSMARKYLNSTSKVEEVDGKYYVTLTFTGAAFMQNHEVYVNGKKVNVTKSTSGDTTNVRFVLSSLSDSIKVKTFVVPMSRDVEFGVTLLEDTLTFIKEYTVETLPQTGAPIGAGAVAGLGLMLTTAGTVLVRKRN